jgi:hypothetical protein
MTTLTSSTTAVRDLRGFWRVLIALVIPLGPLGVTISRGLMPYWTNDPPAAVVALSLANLSALSTGMWLSMIFMAPLLLSVLALGYVARRSAPVLATLGAAIAFTSYAVVNVAGNGDALILTMAQAGFDESAILRAFSTTLPAAGVATGIWVVGHILGTVLLGLALMRTPLPAARWLGLALAVSQPIHFVASVVLPTRALDLTLGWGLTTICTVAVSIAILRTPNDAWDLPPVGKA